MSDHTLCAIVRKTPAPGGGFYYDRIWLNSPRADGMLMAKHPPLIGDTFWLHAPAVEEAGMVRVIARDWQFPGWGSSNFPHRATEPEVDAHLELLVVDAEGWYVDEAVRPGDEDDDNVSEASETIES